MQVFTRNKRGEAQSISDAAENTPKHLRKDKKNISYFAQVLQKTKSRVQIKFSKYADKLHRKPPAEVANPTTSCQPTEHLSLIDPDVARPFHTDFEPKCPASDVVSEATGAPLVQLTPAEVGRPTSLCPAHRNSPSSNSTHADSSASTSNVCGYSPDPPPASIFSNTFPQTSSSSSSKTASSSLPVSAPGSAKVSESASISACANSTPPTPALTCPNKALVNQVSSVAHLESSPADQLESMTPAHLAKGTAITPRIEAPSSTISSEPKHNSALFESASTAASSATSVEGSDTAMSKNPVLPTNGKITAPASTLEGKVESKPVTSSEFSEGSSFLKFRKTLKKLAWKVLTKLGHSKSGTKPEDSTVRADVTLVDTSLSTDNDTDRAQWDKMYAIPTQTFEKLLESVLPDDRQRTSVKVSGTTFGGYHYVVFVDSIGEKEGDIERFVIKIPAHGTSERWRREDEYMLTREAEMMKYVHDNTTIPTPEIVAYSPIIDDTWGFPYIVMSRLPGTSAFDVWFEEDFDFNKKNQVHDTASPEIEQKRVNFLRSLAHEMTKLKDVPFNGIGMPYMGAQGGKPRDTSIALDVTQKYIWSSASDPHFVEERPAYLSTQAYTAAGLNDWQLELTYDDDGQFTKDTLEDIGMRKVFDAVFAHPVFQCAAEDDTFFLQHNDLDMQNILVDEDGNVTGIIDWDGSIALPRCVAHAAVPAFLRRDWFPDNTKSFRHLIFETEHYRQIYAAALVEAGNPDAIYTTKSGIYQAALASIYEGGRKYDFCDKLLRHIPVLGKDTDNVLEILASEDGWKIQGTLEYWLDRILKPQAPQVSMQGVLADLHARFWMTEFDSFFEIDLDDDSEDEKDTESGNALANVSQIENNGQIKDDEHELEDDSDVDLLFGA